MNEILKYLNEDLLKRIPKEFIDNIKENMDTSYILEYNSNTYDLRGLSTDTKPVDSWVGNGSIFFEMDTKKVFMYDAENSTWIEI